MPRRPVSCSVGCHGAGTRPRRVVLWREPLQRGSRLAAAATGLGGLSRSPLRPGRVTGTEAIPGARLPTSRGPPAVGIPLGILPTRCGGKKSLRSNLNLTCLILEPVSAHLVGFFLSFLDVTLYRIFTEFRIPIFNYFLISQSHFEHPKCTKLIKFSIKFYFF